MFIFARINFTEASASHRRIETVPDQLLNMGLHSKFKPKYAGDLPLKSILINALDENADFIQHLRMADRRSMTILKQYPYIIECMQSILPSQRPELILVQV